MAFKMASSKHDRISVYRYFLSSNGALLENSPYSRQKVLSATICDLHDSYDRDSVSSVPRYLSITSLPAGAKLERQCEYQSRFDGMFCVLIAKVSLF